MKKEDRKSLEKNIAAAIQNALPAGLASAKEKTSKVIGQSARNITKKFAKELKKLEKAAQKAQIVKKAKKKIVPAKKKKAAVKRK